MMKKVLAALLAVCMLASLMFIPASAAGFDDVADDHWAKEAIDRWAGYGVLNGKGEGKFDPDANMTRAQFAKFIVTLMGLPTDSTEMPFEDVMGSADEWAAPYIAAAHKAGIINGKSTTRFAPRDNVTFDQSAAMMARAVGLVEPSAFGDAVTEKLTELGMLDDNVKPDADPTRALVAGLADNIIEYYANDAEADAVVVGGTEEATEVKGVILAVNGGKVEVENATVKAPIVVTSEASVEVKSSTVEAPIVVDSASVALTETKAENVVVSGTEASVTADKESSVKEVAVTGTAPSVELNGEVEKVTVAEGTTEAAISGDGVSSENVTNNTGADITVNDETVEPTPAEPDPEKPGESTGFVPEPVTPPADVTEGTIGGGAAMDNRAEAPAASGGTVSTEGIDNACEGEHTWGTANVTKAATCTEAGSAVYTCSVCGATSTVTITALDHEYDTSTRIGFNATQHWTICKYCDATNTPEDHDLTCTSYGSGGHTATCADCGYTVSEAHSNETNDEWDDTNASFHWAICDDCGAKYAQAVHTWSAWGDGTQGDLPEGTEFDSETQKVEKRTCSVCEYEQVRVVAKPTEGGGDDGGDDDDTPVATQHNLTYTQNNDGTHNVTCSVENCDQNHTKTNVTCTYTEENNTKCVCGRVKEAEPTP